MTALCTPQDGLDYLANLRISENESGLDTDSLEDDAEAITSELKKHFVKRGYLEQADSIAVLNSSALILGERLAASKLGQMLMNNRADAIDPALLGIQKAQKAFTDFNWNELVIGRYDPIFFPSSYAQLFSSGSVVPTAPPAYSGTQYSTVARVRRLCPEWTPDSKNQVTTATCQAWIIQTTLEVYALALKRGTFNLTSLTLDQARDLGKIINTGVAAIVLQANRFAASKQQVSVEALEKMKLYKELRQQLLIGEFD